MKFCLNLQFLGFCCCYAAVCVFDMIDKRTTNNDDDDDDHEFLLIYIRIYILKILIVYKIRPQTLSKLERLFF